MSRKARREHYPAPYAIVDLWRKHGASPRTGYEAEAQSVARLVCTPTSRNLVRLFFLQERLKGLGGKDVPAGGHVHVVGAGVMGGDIAAWCALRGFTVTLQDRGMEYVQPALERARAFFDKRSREPGKADATMGRLQADVAGNGVESADIVIEAIYENADAKRELYAALEPRLKPGALLATNTSSLMLESLVDKLAEPARLVGLHFFNPVAQMPLVEVIESQVTSAQAKATALAFTRAIDKLPLPCRSAPGFLVNRVLMPYMSEAMLIAQEGVPLATIDAAAVRFGMAMGPIELADTVGLDVCLHVGKILSAAFGGPAPEAVAPLVEAGKLGRKTGQGLYEWRDGKAVKPATERTGGAGRPRRSPRFCPWSTRPWPCCAKESWRMRTSSMPVSSSAPASPHSAAARYDMRASEASSRWSRGCRNWSCATAADVSARTLVGRRGAQSRPKSCDNISDLFLQHSP